MFEKLSLIHDTLTMLPGFTNMMYDWLSRNIDIVISLVAIGIVSKWFYAAISKWFYSYIETYDFLLFFKSCRSKQFHDSLVRHDTKISKISCDGGRIEAYLLPKNISKWPSFYATKQESEKCSHIFFKRIADSHGYRFDETIRLLRDKKDVISTGLSGIGKSTEINGFLMKFLSHIGEKGWPKEVWYRYDNVMVKYSLSIFGFPQVHKVDASTVLDVFKYTVPYADITRIEDIPVLFLELWEGEVDPKSSIPTYIALSNRNVETITKEMGKAQANYMLVDPPTCEDIQMMAVVEADISVSAGTEHVFQGLSTDQIKQIVKERVDIVGPKLRDLFVSKTVFDVIQHKLEANVSNLFGNLENVSVTNVPSGAKNYIGPFVKPSAEIPTLNRCYVDFLSDYIVRLVAHSCSKENKLKLVAAHFDYMVAESIMCYGLMTHTVEGFMKTKWLYSNWKFYSNTTPSAKRGKKYEIDNPKFPLCTKEVHFASIYLNLAASQLEERTLYRCSLHGALFDALLTCHPNGHKRGVIYVFQSSNLRAKNDSLDYSTIRSVMDGLHFNEDANKQYDLCYVYCSDSSSRSETGCVLSNNTENKVSDKEQKTVKNRLTINIARVCYYPNATEVLL